MPPARDVAGKAGQGAHKLPSAQGLMKGEGIMKKRLEVLKQEMFGECCRYRLDICRDRFGEIVYMVFDAETIDPQTGLPEVIRISYHLQEALAGLI